MDSKQVLSKKITAVKKDLKADARINSAGKAAQDQRKRIRAKLVPDRPDIRGTIINFLSRIANASITADNDLAMVVVLFQQYLEKVGADKAGKGDEAGATIASAIDGFDSLMEQLRLQKQALDDAMKKLSLAEEKLKAGELELEAAQKEIAEERGGRLRAGFKAAGFQFMSKFGKAQPNPDEEPAVAETDPDPQLLTLQAQVRQQQARIAELEAAALEAKTKETKALADKDLENAKLKEGNVELLKRVEELGLALKASEEREAALLKRMEAKAKASEKLALDLEDVKRRIEAKDAELKVLRSASKKIPARIKSAEVELEALKAEHREVESKILKEMFKMMQDLKKEVGEFRAEFKEFAARSPASDRGEADSDKSGASHPRTRRGTLREELEDGKRSETARLGDDDDDDKTDHADTVSEEGDTRAGLDSTTDSGDDEEIEEEIVEETEPSEAEIHYDIEEERDIDFESLLGKTAVEVMGKANHGNLNIVFKSLISSLNKSIAADDEEFTTLEKNCFKAFSTKLTSEGLDFIEIIKSGKNFQTKFFGWADDRAKDLLQDSNEYNADRPKANPRQPLSTTNIKSTARSLDNIKQTLGFEL